MCDCKNSKKLYFITAVLLTVQEVRSEQATFSVHDITKKLRDTVNRGLVELVDKSPIRVDGILNWTYDIDHQEMRQAFRELLREGLIRDLSWRDNGTYVEYTNTIVPCEAHEDQRSTETVTCSGQIRQTAALPAQLPTDWELRDKIYAYLKHRHDYVTMKELQSRFKGIYKTRKEYSELVADMGFAVIQDIDAPVSQWVVRL